MAVPNGLGTAGIIAVPIPPDGAAGEVLTKVTPADYDMAWGSGGGGGGAPTGAEYILGAANAFLPNARLFVDTATITWDLTVANQVKANAVGGSGGGYPPQLGYAGI